MSGNDLLPVLPLLYGIAKRICWNGCEYDDLVQDCVVGLMELKADPVNVRIKASSRMLDYCRRHGRHRIRRQGSQSVKQHHLTDVYTVSDPEPGWVWWEHFNLSPEQQQIVQLFFEQGLEQHEIAYRLAVHPSTVSYRFRQALKKIATRWEHKGVQ